MNEKKSYGSGMLVSEFMCIFTKPWFWLVIVLVAFLQFMQLFYEEGNANALVYGLLFEKL